MIQMLRITTAMAEAFQALVALKWIHYFRATVRMIYLEWFVPRVKSLMFGQMMFVFEGFLASVAFVRSLAYNYGT